MHYYSTYIGEEKVCFLMLDKFSVRVSDKLWAIGEGRPINPFIVMNKTIAEQAANPGMPCKAVFWSNFLGGSQIQDIVKAISQFFPC